ncbi:GNAT family N-acetyltransferase [Iodidimonas sp. SYSU 1G8]|uniref:GNAT family N-acetyltransferase n=1 Tax=Iodidimonas sp. SYSU 1G8 TaxID=3133967 RepID=UPI0031FEF910
MNDDWRIQQVRFPFRVGDVKLISPVLTMLVRGGSFLDRAPGLPGTPAEPLPSACAGYLWRSQPVAGDPAPLATRDGYICYVPALYNRCFVDLSLGHERYMARFSGKTRSTLLRKLKKFETESGGTADFRVYRTPAEMVEFHHLARQVSRLTYQERLLDAGLPDDAGFLAEMRDLAEIGRVYGFLLFLGGAPAAYIYCPAEGEALLYAYVGFDPALSALSPGTVLQLLALRTLFEDGRFRYFDFTEGEGPHKTLFATGSVRCADVYLLRRSAKHYALVGARGLVEALGAGAGSLLDRLGLKRLVKRWLRRGPAAEG